MTKSVLLAASITLAISCSGDRQLPEAGSVRLDRLALQFKNIAEIAELQQLTDQQSDFEPFFGQQPDRIHFTRLISPVPADSGDFVNAEEKYFSIDFNTHQLFIMNFPIRAPDLPYVTPDSLPTISMETCEFGIRLNHGLYFNTSVDSPEHTMRVYMAAADTLTQLTYGMNSAYLKAVSPDEHYLAFLYREAALNLVIIDLWSSTYYAVPKSAVDATRHDFSPRFSEDGKYLVFLRAGDKFSKDNVPYGDIWLLRFHEGK